MHLSQEMHQCNSTHTQTDGHAGARTHTDTHTQPCTHTPQAVVTLLSFLINNAPYGVSLGMPRPHKVSHSLV